MFGDRQLAFVDRYRGLVAGSQAAGARLLTFSGFHSTLDTQRMQTSQIPISQAPALTPLSLSHLCAKYLRVQFQNKLNAQLPGASAAALPQPIMLPVALASELDMIATVLFKAFINRSQ